MLYTILISVVFIAEIIITVAILQGLWRFDKAVLNMDNTITLAKPGIKDICELSRKISSQMLELVEMYVKKRKLEGKEATIKFVLKILGSIILWKLNIKFVNKIRRSKAFKYMAKGLKLLEIIV